MGMRAAGDKKAQGQPPINPLVNLGGVSSQWMFVKKATSPCDAYRAAPCRSNGELMRKPRPNAYNPAQALFLISNDRSGSPLSCPSCAGSIERDPRQIPPPPYTHVTLRCQSCGRSAHYVAGAA